MRARSLAQDKRDDVGTGAPRSASAAALVFLRGRDADGRLRELEALRRAARPVLGALALVLVEKRFYEALGYRCVGDYGRERLGVGARCLREWARVSERLRELPLLRTAVLAGGVSWGVARRVVALATPETEAACLETVRGRTVRAVEAIVRAVREAEGRGAEGPEAAEGEERVRVRIACTAREAGMWHAAVELARRVAGEQLPVWQCAERVAAEAASAVGGELPPTPPSMPGGDSRRPREKEPSGLRHGAYPWLRWNPIASGELPEALAGLTAELEGCSPREIDRRLREGVAFLQSVDFEIGRVLRQMQDRRLFAEIGFSGLAEYARERLDVSPRTARRLIALARSEQRAPAVASAFREGRVTAFQAVAISASEVRDAAAWVARAQRVTLRRLEDDLAAEPRRAIAFSAPPEVARFFLAIVSRVGLSRLLAHAIVTWVELGKEFRDLPDFERDGYRCTVPGCTRRRNLQNHHIWYRGRSGPDVPWNRTTVCAFHHLVSVHRVGVLRITGRAPDALVFELGGNERFASGDVKRRAPPADKRCLRSGGCVAVETAGPRRPIGAGAGAAGARVGGAGR